VIEFYLDFPDRYAEMEYFVALNDTIPVYDEIRKLFGNPLMKTNYPINIRTVKGDDTWLSPAYARDSTAFSITVANNDPLFEYVSKQVEQIFVKYNGRPHWGKHFNLKTKDMTKLYPKLESFNQIRKQMDPKNIFLNDFLQTTL